MSQYLEENFMSPRGYTEKSGRPSSGSYAIALTKEGRPVFGTQKAPPSTLAKLGMMGYDDEVERQRRLLAETALAQIVLERPRYVQRTIDHVSTMILGYWSRKKLTLGDSLEKFSKVVTESQKYLYGETSFGRRNVSELAPTKNSTDYRAFAGVVDAWFSFLGGSARNIPQIMNLHDQFLRLFERVFKDTDPTYNLRLEKARNVIRPKWYEDTKERGRINVDDHISNLQKNTGFKGTMPRPATPTAMPGLLSTDFTIPMVGPLERCGLDPGEMTLESRKRGRDMFLPNASVMNAEFRKVLGENNLPYSASASGTTSTLFMSAITFAELAGLEDKKEYLLACIAYLVGGGMHTCHEVFWTGRLIGIPYTDGKYAETLPRSFTGSRDYEKWTEEFWDIVRPDRLKPRG